MVSVSTLSVFFIFVNFVAVLDHILHSLYCRYMVTSGLDRKLKVYDIRAFKPLHSCFQPAGASCLSLSQRGLLSAATGDIVQVMYTQVTFSG